MGKRLSDAQRKFYEENGYLVGLPPVFNTGQVTDLNDGLSELMKLLRPGEDAKDIREWHESSRFLYDICTNSTILDFVISVPYSSSINIRKMEPSFSPRRSGFACKLEFKGL